MSALFLLFLLAQEPRPEVPEPVRPMVEAFVPVADRVELPEGPCRDRWEASGGTLSGHRSNAVSEIFPPGQECATIDFTDVAWRLPETWCVWERKLRASQHPEFHRITLARLALLQDRWDDAWAHFAHADGVSSVMHAFFPGLPASNEWNEAAALPDGVLLSPAPPPPTPDLHPGFWDVREAWVRGLRIGDAVLDMRIAMEPEGVQVDFEHVSGGTARVRVELPEPVGFQIRVEYVDWLRQDEVGLPLAVVVAPGDETHSLYGRVLQRAPAWPTAAPEHVPAAILAGGLALFIEDADDPERERLDAVGRALGHGCRVVTERPASGVVVHVPPPGPERDRKLAWLASSFEAHALSRLRER